MACGIISFTDSNIQGTIGVMGDVIESMCAFGYLNQYNTRNHPVICDYMGDWTPYITCKRKYSVSHM